MFLLGEGHHNVPTGRGASPCSYLGRGITMFLLEEGHHHVPTGGGASPCSEGWASQCLYWGRGITMFPLSCIDTLLHKLPCHALISLTMAQTTPRSCDEVSSEYIGQGLMKAPLR